jgi:hypothetical protein
VVSCQNIKEKFSKIDARWARQATCVNNQKICLMPEWRGRDLRAKKARNCANEAERVFIFLSLIDQVFLPDRAIMRRAAA